MLLTNYPTLSDTKERRKKGEWPRSGQTLPKVDLFNSRFVSGEALAETKIPAGGGIIPNTVLCPPE